MSSKTTVENRSLLIIKSIEQNLVPVETFLKNRGWKIFSTTDLKGAIGLLIQHQPAFVMISVDHPNQRVLKLSKVIAQAFPCCPIAFAEKTTSNSYRQLSEATTEYLIYPPVTGPAIERTVNKFYKDQAYPGANAMGEKNYSANYQSPEGIVNIKGNGINLQNLMAQFFGEENVGTVYAPEEQTSTDIGATSQDSHNQLSGANTDKKDATYNSTDTVEQSTNNGSGMNRYMPSGENQSTKENFQKSTQSKNFDIGFERQRLGISDEMIIPTRNYKDSVILKGTRNALDKSTVRGVEQGPIQRLDDKTNIHCILIDSPKFSGFLLTAMDKNIDFKEDFIDLVRDKLLKFLAANGEIISDHENMPLELHLVPFEDWAIEHADFLCKTQHNMCEVAMAFFPNKNLFAKISDSESVEMYSIEVTSLEPDAVVKCDIYIYLSANRRYVLYTPRGGKIYSKQIDKLVRQGVSHVHIYKESLQDFRVYYVQNYLNSRIAEFHQTSQ